jgi:hypothetical protein
MPNEPQSKADYGAISELARQACKLVDQQTELMRNGRLSDEQLKQYTLRQEQIRTLIRVMADGAG